MKLEHGFVRRQVCYEYFEDVLVVAVPRRVAEEISQSQKLIDETVL